MEGRVLVLSAPVGEGHVAAARALAARMRERWPGAEVHEVESTAGPLRDRLLRASYAATMRVAPALYGLGYDLLVRHPRFARLCKRVAAARLGRSLAPLLRAEHPDLVVSTYPMISGGLAWLRARDRLSARTVAVVTDVAVHPFWVWAGVDETWTLLPASRAQAEGIEPAADVRVAAPAVDRRFQPGDRLAARRALGLPESAFTVLVTGGSLGFGGLEGVVDAVRAGGAEEIVVLCGRNEGLRRRLRDRATALGWTDRVPELVTAADLVLTTAGGMIASESLAVGTPVLFAMPVPGHGVAGARMTEAAGLGVVCPRAEDVTATIRRLHAHPEEREALAARARAYSAHTLDEELTALATRLS
ncbi:MGDG synthase family glycosyltransferase [Pseudonocardia oroxyli]|uniref:UDP-N-acetylglucosamine:LPS N-acetylglucosamine transferase n=1 Tax=Pseudonocardia oroxyli TaxID=366584 RepID=A0A1G7IB73_PSEOR|nr:glycosyltransferase [Pseudonocardia oroxyli]SDF09609.1 UDP-N-acetylglucosamine:LPS N-acetylglucosamine transferase [Pseudonocardia oroxyli]